MKKTLLLLLACCTLSIRSFAGGHDNSPIGGRAIGLGNASVTLRDHWAMFNNIGGIAGIQDKYAGVFMGNRFNSKSFSTIAAGFVMPTPKEGAATLNFQRFGDGLFNQSNVGLGYGHKIAGVTLGIQLNYMQTSVSEIGSKGVLGVQFGGIAEITPQLIFGAHIFNVTQAKIADYNNERLPTIMKAGLSYRPFDKLMCNVELEKDVDYKALVKAGLEYEIVKKVRVRTGINSRNYSNYFGVGVEHSLFNFDYAATTHTKLGWSHALSLSYKFYQQKTKSTAKPEASHD